MKIDANHVASSLTAASAPTYARQFLSCATKLDAYINFLIISAPTQKTYDLHLQSLKKRDRHHQKCAPISALQNIKDSEWNTSRYRLKSGAYVDENWQSRSDRGCSCSKTEALRHTQVA
ncbi:hypothetical protein [Pseudomonas chlororaphis]|uniref:hypothetical protein n=1 Tax=Pseudomonas chlororaphis TaxID=587753 RepID=UPI000F57FE94|nr:hypothetical protein [Pseudomonas chlororaphis]WDG70401.1 hypothetical protein PUP65_20020 [Pseudomonas chlororaphis]WDH31812.1 hypothetical protein PUP81_14300 [Pseudomonas chlororaphis]WDH68927.1 hypothetical protein PUP78_20005 [Pseudomonas chlororaphis]